MKGHSKVLKKSLAVTFDAKIWILQSKKVGRSAKKRIIFPSFLAIKFYLILQNLFFFHKYEEELVVVPINNKKGGQPSWLSHNQTKTAWSRGYHFSSEGTIWYKKMSQVWSKMFCEKCSSGICSCFTIPTWKQDINCFIQIKYNKKSWNDTPLIGSLWYMTLYTGCRILSM